MRYLLAITIAAAALAVWLFPRAMPVVVLADRIAREEALQSADSFARAHQLPAGARSAVRFQRSDSLITFVELAGGGKDSLDALVRGNDVSPFAWSVRLFTPRDVRETRIHFAANGRPIGFTRRLAEADERPELAVDSARRVADEVLTGWLGEPAERWRLAASSYETQKTSGRVDRKFTYERTDRRVAGAPIRLDVVIAGDTPSAARRYVEIPEGFRRRYGEMRSANELYSLIADVGLLAIVVAGAFALARFVRARRLRWRAPFVVSAVIAILMTGAGLNEMPAAWYDYDTAMSPTIFQLLLVLGALAGGAVVGLFTAVTLVVAEAATRAAFPNHLDWWKLWRYRGTGEVATRVMGGYALAAVALAYVALFYLVTRTLFGWWVPSELLDDPNLIATPAPWLAGLALSLHAAVWEEAIFRALPLSLLSLWVGTRPRRTLWMAGGVIVTALVFGFAHANYPSWPAYSRGVEIFLDACLWGAVFLSFGLIVTVIAHFVYNATLFTLFAAGGSALSYRVTAVVVILAVAAPALVVAWRWARQRGLTKAPAESRFEAWEQEEPAAEPAPSPDPAIQSVLGARARKAAVAAIALAIAMAVLAPPDPVRGPRYTASRADIARTADSAVASRGVKLPEWKRLIDTRTDTVDAWPRFVRRHGGDDLATTLATSYAVPAWWEVRYVRTAEQLAERAEEWRVQVRPDGRALGVHRVVPDSAPGAKPDQATARRIARAELARAAFDTSALVEAKLQETARPSRLDATVTYTDTSVHLPAGAAARVWVALAGAEPVLVRRGIELPESFVREDRDRLVRRALVVALNAIVLLTLVSVGAARVIRRRPPLVAETGISRSALLGAAVLTGAFLLAGALNGAPSILAGYDTAETWSSFLTASIVGVISISVLVVLLLTGIWLAANSLRRRVGIPVFPSGRTSDALVAGAGIGAVFASFGILLPLVSSGIPPAPETSMTQAVPVLSEVLALPPFVLGFVPAVAIPLLLIVAFARGWGSRILLGGLLLAMLAGMTLPMDGGPVNAASVALGVAAIVAIILAIRAWGSLGVIAWIAAALAAHALLGVRSAMHAGNALDTWAHLLGVIAAVAILGILLRLPRGQPEIPSSGTSV